MEQSTTTSPHRLNLWLRGGSQHCYRGGLQNATTARVVQPHHAGGSDKTEPRAGLSPMPPSPAPHYLNHHSRYVNHHSTLLRPSHTIPQTSFTAPTPYYLNHHSPIHYVNHHSLHFTSAITHGLYTTSIITHLNRHSTLHQPSLTGPAPYFLNHRSRLPATR